MAENNNEIEKKKLFGDIFVYNKATGKNKCILENNGVVCGSHIKGSRPFNLKRHLRSVHPDFSDSYTINNPRIENAESEILNAWAEIVTINGRPFSMFQDPGMQKLMDLLFSLYEQVTGKKIQIDVRKIRTHVEELAVKMKKIIMDETKNKIVSLALDICTKCGRTILGINAQYTVNGRTVVRTLGMRLKEAHTAKHVADVVKNTLAFFGISVIQLYGVTSDNASYMLPCSTVLDELTEAAANIRNDDEGNFTDLEEDYFQQILKEAVDDYFGEELADYVFGISCGVHTFQLAIGDAIKASEDSAELIEKCRSIIKKLRTPTILRVMKEKKLHMPLLDCLTRWDGKYTMVSKYRLCNSITFV